MLEDLELKQVIELLQQIDTPLRKLKRYFKNVDWERRYIHEKKKKKKHS